MPVPQLPDKDDDSWEREWAPKRQPPDEDDAQRKARVLSNLEKNFKGDELTLLREASYTRANDFYETNIQVLEQKLLDVNEDIQELNGRILGRRNTKNPTPEYAAETNRLKEIQGTLKK